MTNTAHLHSPTGGALGERLFQNRLARAFLARRRIDMLSEYWALVLIDKYGKGLATARARDKLIACGRHSPGMRSRIWIKIYRRMKPTSQNNDRYYRA